MSRSPPRIPPTIAPMGGPLLFAPVAAAPELPDVVPARLLGRLLLLKPLLMLPPELVLDEVVPLCEAEIVAVD